MHALAFVAAGLASYFSRESSGAVMANGQPMVDSARVCATRHLVPFGTKLLIVNDDNRAESWCVVSDYGPAENTGRIVDVSPAVARDLGMLTVGVVHVRLYRLIPSPSQSRSNGLHVFCPPSHLVCYLENVDASTACASHESTTVGD